MRVDSEQVRVMQAKKQAIYYRNYRRARDRALVRLAQANPAQYTAFLREERQRDEEEGKTWTTLAGPDVSSYSYPSVEDTDNNSSWNTNQTGYDFEGTVVEHESGPSNVGSIRVEG